MRYLLPVLLLAACTEPTPEGPAENAARPCDFEDPRDACDDCEVTVQEDAAGVVKRVSASKPGFEMEQVFDAAGRLLQSSTWTGSVLVVWGCYPDEQTVWFRSEHDEDGGLQCWNTEGVQYQCNAPPPMFAPLLEAAARRT